MTTTCACGLPFVVDNGIARCPHCETRDCHDITTAHPSMECVDCIKIGTNWDANVETEAW